jgi:hypothetical protein
MQGLKSVRTAWLLVGWFFAAAAGLAGRVQLRRDLEHGNYLPQNIQLAMKLLF